MPLFGIQGVHGKYDDIGLGPALADTAYHNIQRGIVTEISAASMVQQCDLVV
jgi:hypothetical protein